MAKVAFRVQPFKYENNEVEIYNIGEGQEMTVTNDGNYISKPLITIKGTGTVVLSLNGNMICRYTFPVNEDTVVIDSETQDAYLDNILKNRNMVGDFPVLQKGVNTLSWSGTVDRISVKRYSRWL